MYCNRDLFVYKDGIDDLRIGTGDVRNNSLRKILADIYCTDAKLTKDKKLKNWDELAKDGNKKDRPKFDGSKEEVTVRPPSRDCKEKCSRKQKVRTPSDEIQYQSQYQGYFYDSIKNDKPYHTIFLKKIYHNPILYLFESQILHINKISLF